MARYTGADCRRCRREKMKLFLKGSKCDGPKCHSSPVRSTRPSTAAAGPRRASTCCSCGRKQKARRIYGVLEKQFRTYYEEANRRRARRVRSSSRSPRSRLDNVVYRAGYAGPVTWRGSWSSTATSR